MSLLPRALVALPGARCLRLAWIAALLALAACTRSEPPADIVMVNGPDPETLDPALATGIEDLRVVAGLFEGLARNDPVTSAPIPGLAESWEVSSNGCVCTFHLRSNLLWQAGEPITAQDVVYSWLRVLDPQTASEYASQLFYVKNAEDYNSGKIKDPSLVAVHALDARTVQVEVGACLKTRPAGGPGLQYGKFPGISCRPRAHTRRFI